MSDGLAGQMLAPWRLPEARLFNEQAKLITQHLLGVGIVGASMLGLFCALTLYWLFDDRTGFFWLACSWLLNSTTYVLLRNVVHRTMTAPRRFWVLVGVRILALLTSRGNLLVFAAPSSRASKSRTAIKSSLT